MLSKDTKYATIPYTLGVRVDVLTAGGLNTYIHIYEHQPLQSILEFKISTDQSMHPRN